MDFRQFQPAEIGAPLELLPIVTSRDGRAALDFAVAILAPAAMAAAPVAPLGRRIVSPADLECCGAVVFFPGCCGWGKETGVDGFKLARPLAAALIKHKVHLQPLSPFTIVYDYEGKKEVTRLPDKSSFDQENVVCSYK